MFSIEIYQGRNLCNNKNIIQKVIDAFENAEYSEELTVESWVVDDSTTVDEDELIPSLRIITNEKEIYSNIDDIRYRLSVLHLIIDVIFTENTERFFPSSNDNKKKTCEDAQEEIHMLLGSPDGA